jgi:hypothetical protein
VPTLRHEERAHARGGGRFEEVGQVERGDERLPGVRALAATDPPGWKAVAAECSGKSAR